MSTNIHILHVINFDTAAIQRLELQLTINRFEVLFKLTLLAMHL